jgi:ribosomal protein L16 Arg81 hydroxylase
VIDFGLSPRAFRDRFFEKEPHHFPGALTGRPFTWSSIDRLLHVIDPTAPTMRMFHHGQLPEQAYTDEFVEVGKPRRRLNKPKFYEYLQGGATLQINWLERHSVEAKRLCLEVGRFAGAQTSGNAYMSFSGDGTFGKHWDTHDVFAIQLVGRKRWRVFSPTLPLPLTYQTHDRSGHHCPAEHFLEVTMEEGDVLYLPRGWWHHVIPLQSGSFHFSVGCYSPTLFDYVVQTSAKYLEQQVDARRSFSPDDYRETVAEMVENLKSVLADQSNAAAFERDFVSRERMNAEFNLAFLDAGAPPLADSALLSLATFSAPTLDGGTLVVNGMKVSLEPLSRAIVAALSGCSSLSVGELCTRVENAPPAAIRRAVLELARHDIVTIQSS